MGPEGVYPIPADIDYLNALKIHIWPNHPTRITLAGCLDEFIFLTHETPDSGDAQIRLSWGGPESGSEILWVASADQAQDARLLIESFLALQHAEIRARYLASADSFQRLSDRLVADRETVQVYCDENQAFVETRTAIHYEGEDSETAAAYFELCRFAPKVVARSGGGGGISFPHDVESVGLRTVQSQLLYRFEGFPEVDRCPGPDIDEPWGQCELPVDGAWVARFSWAPVCRDDEGPEDGC